MSKQSNKTNLQQQMNKAPTPSAAPAPAVDTAKASEATASEVKSPEQQAEEMAAAASQAMNEVVAMDQAKGATIQDDGAGADSTDTPPSGAEGEVLEKAAEAQNSAPVAAAQGTKEIKVGVVVDAKKATLGKEADEAVKQAISQETTAKPVDHSSAFEQKIAKIVAGENGRLRDIALQLQSYVKAMAPGVPLTVEEGVRQQAALFRILRNVVEQDDSFKEVFRLTIQFFKEYKDSVFSGSYIHRFHDSLTLSPRDAIALARLVNLFTIAAGVNQKTDVQRLVNLGATFQQGLTDSARDRVVQYFNT